MSVGAAIAAGSAAAAADASMAKFPTPEGLSGISQPGYGVLVSKTDGNLPAPENYVLAFLNGDAAETSFQFGTSTRPVQGSVDPRSGSRIDLVASLCPLQVERGTPRCELRRVDIVGGSGKPEVVEQPPADAADRLPSIYAGAIAFARTAASGNKTQLRYKASRDAPSVAVPGGPKGRSYSNVRATAVALRGKRLAYVWEWTTEAGQRRSLLQVKTIGGGVRKIASLPLFRGRVTGLAWRGSSVVFGVRFKRSARLYSYSMTTGRYTAAPAAANLTGFAIAGSDRLIEQFGPTSALDNGLCPGSGCSMRARAFPTFRSAQAPR